MNILHDHSTPPDPEALLNDVLARPLFAHLSTMHNDGPLANLLYGFCGKKNAYGSLEIRGRIRF